MRVVIIGNSAAAAGCMEALLEAKADAKITVITDENKAIYGRPLISYYLWGKVKEQNMFYRDENYYKQNGAELIIGAHIEKIDTKAKKAIASDGRVFSYDKLLIATGSSPARPPIEGINSKNTQTFMSWQDADAIKEKLNAGTDAVIAGSGLIGLKAAESLIPHCKSVTVVELFDRVLPTVLDHDNAAVLEHLLKENGIRFMLKQSVAKIVGEEKVEKIILADGTELECSLFILAAGVRPNTQIAKDAGITVNRGIPVDEFSRTNIPGIYAAGDVTESTDLVTNEKKIMALWPNAYLQGEAAGFHMAGVEKPACLMPMNAVTFFGCPIITAGVISPENSIILQKATSNSIKKLYLKDGYLTGIALFNCSERAGLYTSLIKEKIKIENPEDLLNENFGLNWYEKDIRINKLLDS